MKSLKIFVLSVNIIFFSQVFCSENTDTSLSFSLNSSSNSSEASSLMPLFTQKELSELFYSAYDLSLRNKTGDWKAYLNKIQQAINYIGPNINTISLYSSIKCSNPLYILLHYGYGFYANQLSEILKLLLDSPYININTIESELEIPSILCLLKWMHFGKYLPDALKLLINKGANVEKFLIELKNNNDPETQRVYQKPEIQEIFNQYADYKKYKEQEVKSKSEAETVLTNEHIKIKDLVNIITQYYPETTFLEYLKMIDASKTNSSSSSNSSDSSSSLSSSSSSSSKCLIM